MSKSLQDQLLQLGIARKKPAERKKPQRKKAGPAAGSRPKRQAGEASEEIELARAYALRRREEQRLQEQARRRKQEEERRRRELNKALKAIVREHRLNDDQADIPRNFLFKGRIRKIDLTADQLKRLNSGELGVVYLAGRYHLLEKQHVDAVRELSADHVPDLSGSGDDDDEHPVPDDLVW